MTSSAVAQSETPPTPIASKEPAASPPAEARDNDRPGAAWPEATVWVQDNGAPRLLVGVTYEEFFKAWNVYKDLQPSDAAPRYTVHHLVVEGRLEEPSDPNIVTLDITLTVQVHEGGRVAVPIRFRDAIFTGELQGLSNSGEHLAYDAQRGGYLLWLDGSNNTQRREVRLQVLARVDRNADGVRVPLNLPRATQSEVTLDTAGEVIAPAVDEGVLLTPEPTTTGGTRLTIRGAVGATLLSYRTPSQRVSEQKALLRSVGQLFIQINDRSLRSTATLTVDGLGRSFDRFLVRLPPGATPLAPSETRGQGVRIRTLDPEDDKSPRRLVEVSRSTRSDNPLIVKLVTETPLTARNEVAGQQDYALDLAGFEVVDAVLQSGDVAITIEEGVQVDWGARVSASRIEPNDLPADLVRQAPQIAFRYYRPSWRLPVTVGARETRLEATPLYRLEVLPEEVRLTLDTEFRVFGGSAFEFDYRLNGWQRPIEDPVGPVGLIDAEHVRDSSDRLVVPLSRAASRVAEVRLEFQATLKEGMPIDIRLPAPIANAVGPGRLVVVVDPSVELEVDTDELHALEAVAVSPDPSSTDDPSALRTRAYRIDTGSEQAPRFVAKRSTRPGKLKVASDSRVTIEASTLQVDQRLSYDALYQPVESLLLWAPAGIDLGELPSFELSGEPALSELGGSRATVELIGERVDARDFPPGTVPEAWIEAGGVLWAAPLPGPRRGAFELSVSYKVANNAAYEAPFVTPLLLPLLPTGDEWRSTVEASAPQGVSVKLSPESFGWEAATASNPEAALNLTGGDAAGELLLITSPLPIDSTPSTRILNAWFQTWDSGMERQTRVVYRLRSATDRIEITLPAEVDPTKHLELRLDGQPIAPRQAIGDKLLVIDPTLLDGEEHTLSMRFKVTPQNHFVTRLDPPRIAGDASQAACYWEIIQPRRRHAVTTPSGFAGGHWWGWSDGGWGRQPKLTTPQLADWAHADPGPIHAAGEHRYLFVGQGVPDGEWVVYSISRTLAVLAASASILVIGFGLSQLGLSRRKATYYVLAVLAGAIGLIVPGPFLLIVQAGAIGLLLTAATLAADRFIRRKSSASQLILSSQSTSLGVSPQLGAGASTSDAVSTNAPTVSIGAGGAAEGG